MTAPVPLCKALKIGCGTGDTAIWLAQQGFEVTGIDVFEIAIGKAKDKAAQADARCTFAVRNILREPVEGAPFGSRSTAAASTQWIPRLIGRPSPNKSAAICLRTDCDSA